MRNSPAGSSALGHAHITAESCPQTPRGCGDGHDLGFPHGCPHCTGTSAGFGGSSCPHPAGRSQHSSADCSSMLSQATQSSSPSPGGVFPRQQGHILPGRLPGRSPIVCALQVSNKHLKTPPRLKYPAANPASIGQCHFDFHSRLHLPRAPEPSIHKE